MEVHKSSYNNPDRDKPPWLVRKMVGLWSLILPMVMRSGQDILMPLQQQNSHHTLYGS